MSRRVDSREDAHNADVSGRRAGKNLSNGRVRYYQKEVPSTRAGYIRGRRFVVEHNLRTGQVRSWMEILNRDGKVETVHPKNIDGMELDVPHYPYTPRDLEKFFGGAIECLKR